MEKNQQEKVINILEGLGLNIFLVKSMRSISHELKKEVDSNLDFNTTYDHKIILIGAGGAHFWKNFKSPITLEENPVDTFCIDLIHKIKKEFLNEKSFFKIIYPISVAQFSLQKISREMGFSKESPIGIDISQQFGLWFSFRLLIISNDHIFQETIQATFDSPCNNCLKYCLNEKNARLACPYQKESQYSQEQLDYHHQASIKLASSIK